MIPLGLICQMSPGECRYESHEQRWWHSAEEKNQGVEAVGVHCVPVVLEGRKTRRGHKPVLLSLPMVPLFGRQDQLRNMPRRCQLQTPFRATYPLRSVQPR